MTNPASFLAHYAKTHHAGAFATPTAKELAADPGSLFEWRDGETRTVAIGKRLTRDSKRTDWTGRPITLPKGAMVANHVARTPDAPIPRFDDFDYLYTYREDTALSAGLKDQGRVVIGTRITAASEIIACWGRQGDTARRYLDHDLATVTRMPTQFSPEMREAVLAEVSRVNQWHDDYPYYSDGSWSAVSLRGFNREDPRWGVKPSEMPRKWKDEHPEALSYPCEWTVLADRCPSLRKVVERVEWWSGLERVRLLQMAGRGGKGGKLGRHTDITDRDGGTRDGQIVRFHIPLVTHPDIKLHSWDLDGTHRETHLPEWSMWYLDARKPHAVVNPTGVDRVHLVVDVVADQAVREQIAATA